MRGEEDYSFMELYRPWWDTGCDACGVSEGDCECLQNWEDRAGVGSKPKWWGWLIAPMDLSCRFCGRWPSTYDGCCNEGDAYLRYRYTAVFFPERVNKLKEYINGDPNQKEADEEATVEA